MPPDSLGNASGFAMILSGNSLRIRFQRHGFPSAFRARFLRDVLSEMQGFEKSASLVPELIRPSISLRTSLSLLEQKQINVHHLKALPVIRRPR